MRALVRWLSTFVNLYSTYIGWDGMGVDLVTKAEGQK